MVQTGRLVQPLQRRWQCDRETPFVGSSSINGSDLQFRRRPPWCEFASQRLDDEHAYAASGRLNKLCLQPVSRRLRQLVQHVARDDRGSRSQCSGSREVTDASAAIYAEFTVRPPCFGNGPRMTIDANDRSSSRRHSPCCARNTRSTSEIDDQTRGWLVRLERLHHAIRGEKVQGRIEERECGTFARAVERSMDASIATLDIGRRERAKCARDFGHAEIREVPRVERAQPATEYRRIFDVQCRPNV